MFEKNKSKQKRPGMTHFKQLSKNRNHKRSRLRLRLRSSIWNARTPTSKPSPRPAFQNHRDRSIHIEREHYLKIPTFGFMLSQGIFEKRQTNISVFKNSFPYSADVKPIRNKN